MNLCKQIPFRTIFKEKEPRSSCLLPLKIYWLTTFAVCLPRKSHSIPLISKHVRDTWVCSIRHQPKNSHIKWMVRWCSWSILGFSSPVLKRFESRLSASFNLLINTVNTSVGDDLILATKILRLVKEALLVTPITSASLVLVFHFCLLLLVSISYFVSYNWKQYVTPKI